jgi:hypothetical protein
MVSRKNNNNENNNNNTSKQNLYLFMIKKCKFIDFICIPIMLLINKKKLMILF